MDQDAFDLTKYFITSSLEHFQIDADKTHAALLSFGNDNRVIFDFNTKQDLEGSLKQKIRDIAFVPGKGQIVDLLKMACDNIFCAAGGTRNSVPKVSRILLLCAKVSLFVNQFKGIIKSLYYYIN